MVRVSHIAEIVKKTTGGRLWNKPWGLPSPSKTQRRNTRKQRNEERQVTLTLKQAAARQPEQYNAPGSGSAAAGVASEPTSQTTTAANLEAPGS